MNTTPLRMLLSMMTPRPLALPLFVFAAAISMLNLEAGAFAAEKDRHVVVISIDGFPAEMLTDPSAPVANVRKLAQEGVAAEGMTVSNPSVTWPNHTTIVTGV